MQFFTSQMRMIFSFAFFALAVVAVLWGVLPDFRVFLQSLFLGMITSTINGAVLFAKTWRVGLAASNPAMRPRGTGMLQRFLLASLAIYWAISLPQHFVLSGVLAGLFLIQLLSIIAFLIRSF
ncbi:MAG: ATP synthase subunit I [Brevibacillus sp.]|nr:ATP synthase subunit I [Brevibacillus sp.]